MNWPNRLSILRVLLVPVIVLCLYANTTVMRILALVFFILASFTDWLDGRLARKLNIVTNFGKFIDPVADKLLVLSTMITLCGLTELPAWACVIVLFRELAVDGLRLVAMEQGKVIAAGQLGKLKTRLQMLMLVVYLLNPLVGFPALLLELLLLLAVAMTLWSGVDYFVRNASILSSGGDKA